MAFNLMKRILYLFSVISAPLLVFNLLHSVAGWEKYKSNKPYKSDFYASYVAPVEIEPDASDPTRQLDSYPHLLGVVASLCPKEDEHIRMEDTPPVYIYSVHRLKIKLELISMEHAVDSMMSNGFNLTLPTILFAHGWLQHGESEWLNKMSRTYHDFAFRSGRKEVDFNLLTFDWSQASSKPYQQAVKFIPNIGTKLGQFFQVLHDRYNYSLDNVHLVGYSLGAHIVGVAGRTVAATHNQIRQVTALDPAGPCFYLNNNFARKYTLGPDVAETVVARHYSYGLLGARGSTGDIAIYVNGGVKQPALKLNPLYELIPGGVEHSGAVMHEIKAAWSTDTCQYVAYQCSSYANFMDGHCATCDDTNQCYHIDIFHQRYTPKPVSRINMYIKTGFDQACVHHYQVVVKTRDRLSANARAEFKMGRVKLDFGSDIYALVKGETQSEGETVYTALVTTPNELTSSSEIKLVYVNRGFVSMKDLTLLRLNYMSNMSEDVRRAKSLTFCPSPRHTLTFERCSSNEAEKLVRQDFWNNWRLPWMPQQ